MSETMDEPEDKGYTLHKLTDEGPGPYYSVPGEVWKDGNVPMERAFVRGPGIDGTILGPSARSEARARVQQLNYAYERGRRAGIDGAELEARLEQIRAGTEAFKAKALARSAAAKKAALTRFWKRKAKRAKGQKRSR